MTVTAATPRNGHQIGKDFILAGNATFTLVGRSTRFTYRIQRADPREGQPQPPYFVSLLTGSNNETDYSYIGLLVPGANTVRRTSKSRVTLDSPAMKAINWALPILFAGRQLPAPAAAFHEGTCGRCGRKLTTPESVALGIGPDCAGKMGLAEGPAPAAVLAGDGGADLFAGPAFQ